MLDNTPNVLLCFNLKMNVFLNLKLTISVSSEFLKITLILSLMIYFIDTGHIASKSTLKSIKIIKK